LRQRERDQDCERGGDGQRREREVDRRPRGSAAGEGAFVEVLALGDDADDDERGERDLSERGDQRRDRCRQAPPLQQRRGADRQQRGEQREHVARMLGRLGAHRVEAVEAWPYVLCAGGFEQRAAERRPQQQHDRGAREGARDRGDPCGLACAERVRRRY
jgi:hypothetical protein